MNTAKAILLASKRKSQVANYMLWLFLGGFGGNSFYVGNTGMGIINIIGTLTAMASIGTPNAGLWLGVNACLLIVSIIMSHGQVDLVNRNIEEEILKAG